MEMYHISNTAFVDYSVISELFIGFCWIKSINDDSFRALNFTAAKWTGATTVRFLQQYKTCTENSDI